MYQGMQDASFRFPTIHSFIEFESDIFAGAAYFSGIFHSTDEGGSWSVSSNGLADHIDIYSFAIIDSKLFAATDDGVKMSADYGATWTSLNEGFPDKSYVLTLASNETDIWAALGGGQIWSRSLSELPDGPVAVNQKASTAKITRSNIRCSGNDASGYHVDFSLIKQENVTLKIYTAQGQETATIANQGMTAGTHSVKIESNSLCAGSYIVRLFTHDVSYAGRLVIVG
jgi:hypothetical protein